ncbi:hypothetical protein [Mesorhizobium sp. ORM16]|uniref:hypothetical protein n=1 Tax=Mesorhizobium sp. ORM16 TaxID=3376989 RepID=UPI0038575A2D
MNRASFVSQEYFGKQVAAQHAVPRWQNVCPPAEINSSYLIGKKVRAFMVHHRNLADWSLGGKLWHLSR